MLYARRLNKSTSTSAMALSLNEHRATSAVLTHRLTSMSLGFGMGQKGMLILEWWSCTDLRGCTRQPLYSQFVLVVLVDSLFWTEAIDQFGLELEVLVRASKPSTPRIGTPSRSGLSLRVHRIHRVSPNEWQGASNNFARMPSEASAVVLCSKM